MSPTPSTHCSSSSSLSWISGILDALLFLCSSSHLLPLDHQPHKHRGYSCVYYSAGTETEGLMCARMELFSPFPLSFSPPFFLPFLDGSAARSFLGARQAPLSQGPAQRQKLTNFKYLFLYLLIVHVCACHDTPVEAREQTEGVGSPLP